MTIPSTTRKAGPLLGTGVQTAWPFTFKVFTGADILVAIADSNGTETTLVLDTDYSVTLNANQETSPGGTVTYPLSGAPLAVGSTLTVVGNIEYDQPLDLPAGGNFSPAAIENELDRLMMQIQQLREVTTRAFLSPVSSSASGQLPAPAANTLIGWDTTGSSLQNVPLSSISTSATYGAMTDDPFTGDGVTTSFLLTHDPIVLANMTVVVDGLTLKAGTAFTLSAGHVVFAVAPSLGAEIVVRYGQALDAGTVLSTGIGDATTTGRSLLTAASAAVARSTLGVAPRAARVDVASAATLDLTALAPDTDDLRLTGTGAITLVNLAVGRVVRIVASGASSFANNANIVTQTGATLQLAAGDTLMLRATAANVVEVLNYAGAAGFPDASSSVKGKIQLATSAEVQVGTDAAKAITPATLKGGIGFSKFFKSTPQAVTGSSITNVAHGLGANPQMVRVTLQNIVAEGNFVPGDEIEYNQFTYSGTGYVQVVSDVTNTTIIVQGGSIAAFNRVNQTTFNINMSFWKWTVRAWA